ncbi:MAG: hypothetical protein J1F20_02920 [Muribaculaceae bacterium]|nr:hypothetical protein [Muribaculaceae bacterium]
MKRSDYESEEFRKYRENIHGSESEKNTVTPNKAMRAIFSIIMIIVYVGVGVLLLINFFGWTESIAWIRWIIGIVLIIYGAYRAYRYIAGIDS